MRYGRLIFNVCEFKEKNHEYLGTIRGSCDTLLITSSVGTTFVSPDWSFIPFTLACSVIIMFNVYVCVVDVVLMVYVYAAYMRRKCVRVWVHTDLELWYSTGCKFKQVNTHSSKMNVDIVWCETWQANLAVCTPANSKSIFVFPLLLSMHIALIDTHNVQ